MDPVIFTPRLKLIFLAKAERGSPEFEWLNELHSNEKSTWWSIHGRAKSVEDSEKVMKGYLPTKEGEKTYRVAYAVHEILQSNESQSAEQQGKSTRFIGLITVKSLGTSSLALPENFTIPAAAATTTLTVEIAYTFLPIGWGKGYATESVVAVFESCKRAVAFWTPFSKLYVRAMVNADNPASRRVMDKSGMINKGLYEFTTDRGIFLAGEWREQHSLHIFGMYLLE
ncbi:hypothetical protein NA57DRAFT_50152 [Rhizodiscina lignyota]|uniref:N-acetyltransferase domain-containing protein n=1 Tax=Rhizodiscina lignyota TaxID=1504668 RepID=A0A9P4I3K3_9PEZI|nr:hypothetical protein NA57DRAFT_50152 [Rhizodiscina lignyota]